MRKLIALILTLVIAISVFALPAAAATITIDLNSLPHNSEYKHKRLMIIGFTEGVHDYPVEPADMMTM